MVQVNVKPDCGNAPKKLFLRDFHIGLANQDRTLVLDSVADAVQWEQVGSQTLQGKSAFEQALNKVWETQLQEVTIDQIITHGNVASVNGTAKDAQGKVYGFCDVYVFTSHAKHARIKSITSYRIEKDE